MRITHWRRPELRHGKKRIRPALGSLLARSPLRLIKASIEARGIDKPASLPARATEVSASNYGRLLDRAPGAMEGVEPDGARDKIDMKA